MKFAGVRSRGTRIFVTSFHRTVSGALFQQDDPRTLNENDLEGIGLAIRSALDAYRVGVPAAPNPREKRGDQLSSLYAAAGVRTSREFCQGAKSTTLKLDGGQITLTPWKNLRAHTNFVPLSGRDHVIPETASNRDVGIAVIATLEDAE
jgi:hypothetical protein